MKFSVFKKDLIEVLSFSSKAVPVRTTLPILSCAFFDIKKNIVNIRTTDLEVHVSSKIEGTSDFEGQICISINKVLEIASVLSDDRINFEILKTNKIKINSMHGEYSIMGNETSEFPSKPNIEQSTKIEFEGLGFGEIINQTVFATSRDDLKPALQGVGFFFKDLTVATVATDGHRLVKYEVKVEKEADMPPPVVIPVKFLKLLQPKVSSKEKTNLEISENHVKTKIGKTTIITRIIKESFPDYESVIPTDNNVNMVINKQKLIETLKRVSIFSNKTTKQITLNINREGLTVSTEDAENVSEGSEFIKCNYDNEPLKLGFNSTYLLDILQHEEEEDLVFLLKESLAAAIIFPKKQYQNQKQTKLTLLMPIRLND